ncbi:MAG: sortase, partial [Clostridia bacterium]|nr:sortase [Clostridia bacterium]
RVDQIRIVLPGQLDDLYVQKGEDFCTLVTCTPYGINTHRMLVRGTRIENIEEDKKINVITQAYLVDPFIVTPAVAAPMLGALLIFLMVKSSKENKKNAALLREKKKNAENKAKQNKEDKEEE